MSFQKLNVTEPILKALANEGYSTPTPIQSQAIPFILQQKDIFGCAQTGTGKTAAFAIPVIQLLHEQKQLSKDKRSTIKALVLSPTRELAIQIKNSFDTYGRYTGLRNAVIFGGVSQQTQVSAIQRGIDILVATPGRLIDLIDQRYVDLRSIEYLVLDEADRMLDMGFVHDVKKIIARLPKQRQTLFFSATVTPVIRKLADTLLTNPVDIKITPVSSTAETVQQTVYFVDKGNKQLLLKHLLLKTDIPTALVFTRTKHGADRVAKALNASGVRSAAIHGNKSQNARQYALEQFRKNQIQVLVATDIAARGIDVEGLTHVINYELPNIPESYVHRIGRTGRAGNQGLAVSFCDHEEKLYLRDIQKLINKVIPVEEAHPYKMAGNQAANQSINQAANRNKPKPNNRNHRGSAGRRFMPAGR